MQFGAQAPFPLEPRGSTPVHFRISCSFTPRLAVLRFMWWQWSRQPYTAWNRQPLYRPLSGPPRSRQLQLLHKCNPIQFRINYWHGNTSDGFQTLQDLLVMEPLHLPFGTCCLRRLKILSLPHPVVASATSSLQVLFDDLGRFHSSAFPLTGAPPSASLHGDPGGLWILHFWLTCTSYATPLYAYGASYAWPTFTWHMTSWLHKAYGCAAVG